MKSDPHVWVHNPPFAHCGGNLFIGSMLPEPKTGEFDAVLSVGAAPLRVEDEVRHRYIPIARGADLDLSGIDTAIGWAVTEFQADHSLLVRSEGGRQRPALIVAGTFVRLGATFAEALHAVRSTGHGCLTDDRCLRALRQLEGQG